MLFVSTPHGHLIICVVYACNRFSHGSPISFLTGVNDEYFWNVILWYGRELTKYQLWLEDFFQIRRGVWLFLQPRAFMPYLIDCYFSMLFFKQIIIIFGSFKDYMKKREICSLCFMVNYHLFPNNKERSVCCVRLKLLSVLSLLVNLSTWLLS